jgi:hypothetical protein
LQLQILNYANSVCVYSGNAGTGSVFGGLQGLSYKPCDQKDRLAEPAAMRPVPDLVGTVKRSFHVKRIGHQRDFP